jgi:thiol-disulfide isomerase/thioredoxin
MKRLNILNSLLLGMLILLVTSVTMAAEFLPFTSKSRAAIEEVHRGKPFILIFWSVDCAYCEDDLKLLGDVVKQYPDIGLVTVCTDDLENAANAKKVLSKMDLPAYQSWQFAESDAARLRYHIDRKWYGELPRTYFYNAQHHVKAVSGKPEQAWLEAWLKGLSTKP